jgi:hypothetical protein
VYEFFRSPLHCGPEVSEPDKTKCGQANTGSAAATRQNQEKNKKSSIRETNSGFIYISVLQSVVVVCSQADARECVL